jgi:hypothetical protein
MIPNKLTPRGIFVPTTLIFHADLPPATLRTWIQLRCLAWTGWSTPPLSMAELASRLGIHASRLSKHLAQLKESSALTWRFAGNEKIVISFPEEFTELPAGQADSQSHLMPVKHLLERPETQSTASYFPAKILGYLSYEDDELEYPVEDDICFLHPYPHLDGNRDKTEQPTSETMAGTTSIPQHARSLPG